MVYSEKGVPNVGDGSWGEQGQGAQSMLGEDQGLGASRATPLFGVRAELAILQAFRRLSMSKDPLEVLLERRFQFRRSGWAQALHF